MNSELSLQKTNEIHVSLVVSSELLGPEEISATLGLTPLRSWRVGETRQNTIIVEKENGCVFAPSATRNAVPVHEQLGALLDSLESRREAMQSLVPRATLEISVLVYAYEYMPALHFGRALLLQLASFPVELDFDLYDLADEH